MPPGQSRAGPGAGPHPELMQGASHGARGRTRGKLRPDASVTEARTYVLDTTVLLTDPRALRRFAEHEVVLPVVVITELEGKRAPSRARLLRPAGAAAARRPAGPARAARRADAGRRRRRHAAGRAQPQRPVGAARRLPARRQRHPHPGRGPQPRRRGPRRRRWSPRTCRMRVKAASVGLAAEEYRAELAVESGWTGMAELEVDRGRRRRAVRPRHRSTCADGPDLPCHTGLRAAVRPRARRWAG